MFDMSILYCEKDNKKSRREEQTRLLTIFTFLFTLRGLKILVKIVAMEGGIL